MGATCLSGYRLRDADKEKVIQWCTAKYGEMRAQVQFSLHTMTDGSGQYLVANQKQFRLPLAANRTPYGTFTDTAGRIVLSNGESLVHPDDLVTDMPLVPALPGLPGAAPVNPGGNTMQDLPAGAVQRFSDHSHHPMANDTFPLLVDRARED